jgi:hypothetical protein
MVFNFLNPKNPAVKMTPVAHTITATKILLSSLIGQFPFSAKKFSEHSKQFSYKY